MALGRWARIDALLLAWVLGGGTDVPLIAAVASQLTADGAGTAPLQVGDGSHAPALLAQRCQCHPFFSLQMFVSRFHMRTLPVLGSVALWIGECLGISANFRRWRTLQCVTVMRNPSARVTFKIVSNRGAAPGASALYKLSRPNPVSRASCAIPRARAT